MDEYEPLKYIDKIVLEILDRPRFWLQQWRDRSIKKFNIQRFNVKEAAYAFLRQYDRQQFVKAQKIIVWHNNQELHLCVRDLIYGKINKTPNSSVEFIYRNAMFSEIRWPVVTVNRINRVRWAFDYNESNMDTKQAIHINENDDTSINVDDEPIDISTQVVSSVSNDNAQENDQVLPASSKLENTINSVCQKCQIDRSVSDLEQLINNNEENLLLENQHRYRTSLQIQINQYNNQ